jgi:hypothetical protein
MPASFRIGGNPEGIQDRPTQRPIQAEYLMTKIPDGLNSRQNNFRFGAGIVFRFG